MTKDKIGLLGYIKMEILEWLDVGLGFVPGRIGRALRAVYWRTRIKHLGRKPSIGVGFRVFGPENVSIGKNFCSSRYGFFAAEGGRIVCGDFLAINTNVHINASLGGTIEIGNRVMIGPNCVLRASDHATDDPAVPIQLQGHRGGKIVLEDDVWIGANVVVVPGVRISRGSVVAAGAVVTKDVEPWSVVGGVPARLIKKRAEELLETI